MEIKTIARDGVTIIEISDNLDANTVQEAQDVIMPLVVPDCLLILDMSKCEYVSSAGLRLLLMVAKRLKANQTGQWCLAGVSEEIMDVMEMTGFVQFFETFNTVSDAIEAVRKEA
jgi:anti-anti-sigma factor